MNTTKNKLGLNVELARKDINGKWRYGIIPNVWRIEGTPVWLNKINGVHIVLAQNQIALVKLFGELNEDRDLAIEVVYQHSR